MFRLSLETTAQPLVLGCNSHRAAVEMAFTHQDTTETHQGNRTEAKLFGPQHSGNDDIASGPQLAVHLDPDIFPELVLHKDLLGLSKA
jgi:hypothetical protein